jgi:hypothetical protein
MSKITGSALALLAAVSFLPLAESQAGPRHEKHRVVKHHGIRMVDRNTVRRHRPLVKVVNRNVVIVDVGAGNRHQRSKAYGTYSGDVDIYSTDGIGQWSYGSSSATKTVVTIHPKAKIIDVDSLKPDHACAMQAGVCVIRP